MRRSLHRKPSRQRRTKSHAGVSRPDYVEDGLCRACHLIQSVRRCSRTYVRIMAQSGGLVKGAVAAGIEGTRARSKSWLGARCGVPANLRSSRAKSPKSRPPHADQPTPTIHAASAKHPRQPMRHPRARPPRGTRGSQPLTPPWPIPRTRPTIVILAQARIQSPGPN